MSEYTPADEIRRAELRRMKTLATGLLVGAAAVFVVARILGHDGPAWWGYLEATAEAAMVGALADWFAVTALFRHPLGLPIPHTAIVQTRKDAIGASLGGFVRDNFLTAEVVMERLRHAHLAQRLGDWLSEPTHASAVSAQSAAVVRGVTEVLQDDLVQGGIEQVVMDRARAVEVTPLVGKAIDTAVEGLHHQALLDTILHGLDTFLGENDVSFRQRLYQESPWWVPEPVDDVVFDKLATGARNFLKDVIADPTHEMRVQFHARVVQLAAELKTSPELRTKGEELKDELMTHPEVRAWVSTLWSRIKTALLDATDDPESALRTRIDEALVEAGQRLQRDPELRVKIDDWISDAVAYIAEQFRGEVADLIASTVQRWDTAETAERLELQVGRDLQFIRINGTIVGGLVGFTIHAVSELVAAVA